MPQKILFAGNDGHFAKVSETFFSREEFVLLRARTSSEALQLIEEQEPALAFIALDLPPAGGDSCGRQVKKDFLLRRTKLVLLAEAAEEDSEACRESGADAILTLPVDGTALLDSARRLLNLPDPGRLAPRAPACVALRYRRCGTQEFERGSTVNLSTGGLFVQGEKLFPRDSRLDVEFDMRAFDGPLFTLAARVAWVNHLEWVKKSQFPAGMGLELLDLGLQEMVQLEQLVAKILSASSE